jgi:hypothetical protein
MEYPEKEIVKLKRALHKLDQYVSKRNYKGYDPYDVLMGRIPFKKFGKWPPILAIQVFKRNPLNFRALIGVPKSWNPKGLGLFLQGYSYMPKTVENERKCKWLFDKLMELKSDDTPGLAWGYPFPWASPVKYLEAWSPTSVVSGFIAQGLFAYYKTYNDPRALAALEEICVFLTEALAHTENDDIYAISYSTVSADYCYNASLLAAQTYALTASLNGNQAYAQMAKKALHSVLKRQKSDGSWNYSEDIESGKQRVQIDFHQGFILDSILSIAESLNYYPAEVEKALQEGFEFYREKQFTYEGRALWRLPGNFPADIHHQAQGILTSLRYYRYSRSRRAADLSKSVMAYTIKHFQDSRGNFYYRKHAYFTDRTSYMRWGNAWMFLAMAETLRDAEIALTEEKHFSPLSRNMEALP